MLPDVLELTRALKQEEQLGLQRCRARVAVEPLQERILLGLLQYQLAAEAVRQPLREAGLADANWPFDDNQTMRDALRQISRPWILAELFIGAQAVGADACGQVADPSRARARSALARCPAEDTGRNCVPAGRDAESTRSVSASCSSP